MVAPSSNGTRDKVEEKKMIELRLWLFKFEDSSSKFGVVVQGYRENQPGMASMGHWSSSSIKSVSNHGRIVETHSGSKYKLVGDIDRREVKHLGFPDTLIKLFENGFPANWEALLKEYYGKMKATNPLNASKWFDHQMAMEKKRQSMGIKLSRKSTAPKPVPEEDKHANMGESATPRRVTRSSSVQPSSVDRLRDQSVPADVREKDSEMTRRRPSRTPQKKADSGGGTEKPARTPRARNVSASPANRLMDLISSVETSTGNATSVLSTPGAQSLYSKEKNVTGKTGPTPRFVPISGGSKNKGNGMGDTPRKRGRPVKQLVFPEVPEESPTPRRSSRISASPAPTTPRTKKNMGATPSKRVARSASVQPSPARKVRETSIKKPETPRATPKRTPRAQSAAPERTRTPSVAMPQKSHSDNQTGGFKAPSLPTPPPAQPVKQRGASCLLPLDLADSDPDIIIDHFKAPSGPIEGKMPAANPTTKKKINWLSDWYIKFYPEQVNKSPDYPPFILVGNNRSDPNQPPYACWHTTLITRVVEGPTQADWSFFTARSSEYKIRGFINFQDMRDTQFFTKDTVKAFMNGFPPNWKELLWKDLNNFKAKKLQNQRDSDEPQIIPQPSEDTESLRSRCVTKKAPTMYRAESGPVRSLSELINRAESAPVRSLSEVAVPQRGGRSVEMTMPTIAAERGGGERVKARKRELVLSESDSSDNEAVVETLRAYKFDGALPIGRRGPAKKRSRPSVHNMDVDVGGFAEYIERIKKRKEKLSREMAELDRIMVEVCANMEKQFVQKKRLEKMEREDYEREKHWRSKQMKQQQGRRHQAGAGRRRAAAIETSSDDSAANISESSEEELTSSSSTETDVSDDGGEWRQTKARSYAKKARLSTKKHKVNIFAATNKTTDEDSDEDEIVNKKKAEKKRNWRQKDLDRLKCLLKLQPVQREDDWKRIARQMGEGFLPEDCKDMAMKRQLWQQPKEKMSRNPDEEAMVITTRQGTQAHAVQADAESRKYMLGAGSQDLDVLRDTAPPEDDDDLLVGNGDLDLDNSMMALLMEKTPKEAPKKKNRARGPAVPAFFADEETPVRGRRSSQEDEPGTAEREQHQRYLHHITNNKSHLNQSRMNNTSMMHSFNPMDRSRALDKVTRKIDKIQKTVKNQTMKRPSSDIDEENEDLVETDI